MVLTDEVFLDVQNGDVLTDLKRDKNIKNTIGEVIKAYLIKNKFNASDLKGVFQITDSDGGFIPKENVVVNAQLHPDEVFYAESCIQVYDENKKKQIEKRNEQKVKNINILSTTNFFNIERVKIPYKFYYFSTNLDHVLWHEQNEKKDQKIAKAEKFLDSLEGTIEDFLWEYSAISNEEVSEQSYKKSWSILADEMNSLKRMTNVTLLFDLARNSGIN